MPATSERTTVPLAPAPGAVVRTAPGVSVVPPRRRLRLNWIKIASFLGILVAWEAVVRAGQVSPLILPLSFQRLTPAPE